MSTQAFKDELEQVFAQAAARGQDGQLSATLLGVARGRVDGRNGVGGCRAVRTRPRAPGAAWQPDR